MYDFYCEEAISGKTAISKLYESDAVLAFHHTKPSYEVHIVIVPKEHIKDFTEIANDTLLIEIMHTAQTIIKSLDYQNMGVKFLTNLGTFQDTPHLHFHVIAGKKID